MSIFYREPSINASYLVSVHLTKRFQRRRFFRNQPIRNKNCLWWPCLLMDLDDFPQMLPTKFLFIWPNGFRGEESKKSAIQKQESPVVAMFVNGSGRNQHYLQRTFHRCFLSSFILFGQAVSEEKLFQKSTNKKQKLPMTAMFVNVEFVRYCGGHFENGDRQKFVNVGNDFGTSLSTHILNFDDIGQC